MKALVYHGRGDIRCETVPDPKIEDGRDAIIKVTACAICGSDLHLMGGFVPGMKSGDVLGHECMGEVVEVGRDNKRLKIGESMGSETTMQKMASAVQSTISASDRPYALNDAILSCRPGGVVSVPGVYMGSAVPTAMGAFMNKGLTMRTGQTHVHKYMEKLMRLIEEGKVDPTVIISHRTD